MSKLIQGLLVVIFFSLSANASLAATFVRNTIGTPNDGSTVSGVGLFSGYSCDYGQGQIEVKVDGVSIGEAGAGTNMPSLANPAYCGHADVGWSILYNFSNLAEGQHTVVAYGNGVAFATATFTVVRADPSTPWLSGLQKEVQVQDFPAQGETATLDWYQSYQNFVITNVKNTTTSLDGTYKLSRSVVYFTASGLTYDSSSNISASGSMYINGNSISQSFMLTLNGVSFGLTISGTFTDYGTYVKILNSNGLYSSPIVLKRGDELITLLATSSTSEADDWQRVSSATANEAKRRKKITQPIDSYTGNASIGGVFSTMIGQ